MCDDTIKSIKGIGDKTAALFAKLGIKTMNDLMVFFPYRYIKYNDITLVRDIHDEGTYAIRGRLLKPITTYRYSSRPISGSVISDSSGEVNVSWFNMPYLAKSIRQYEEYVFVGAVSKQKGRLCLIHPKLYNIYEYEKLIGSLSPVYNLTAGLSNNTVIKAVNEALKRTSDISDTIPASLKLKYKLIDYYKAICDIHNPASEETLSKARYRLVFEDFFRFLYYIRMIKEKTNNLNSIYNLDIDKSKEYTKEFLALLPYTLTDKQLSAIEDINNDLTSGMVTSRLVQGDVGSGKTVVATAALYEAYRAGYQSAIMVPTEILAVQHFNTLSSLFENASNKPRLLLLTGSLSEKEKRSARESIKNHEADIIIGTHALITDTVEFDKLAVIVTDEQHRFGVAQREELSKKSLSPHVIVMSATPIPRTLAVIIYGDLSISVIDTKPVGRIPVKNCVITKEDRQKAYRHIYNELQLGHQAYVVCPMVEENEALDDNIENVIDYSKKLQKTFKDKAKIAYIHGRMHQSEKNDIMNKFYCGEIDILVSTTVIEVGVDVPNATVMLIENAERFGLATLHQLRGRIGRGSSQSYCIFVRTSNTEEAKKRLDIVGSSNDGFYIASEDLKMRGPGELLGLSQSGDMRLGIADLSTDMDVLKMAYAAVNDITSSSLPISNEEYILLNKGMESYSKKLLSSMNL